MLMLAPEFDATLKPHWFNKAGTIGLPGSWLSWCRWQYQLFYCG
jgi:hypothetical protein